MGLFEKERGHVFAAINVPEIIIDAHSAGDDFVAVGIAVRQAVELVNAFAAVVTGSTSVNNSAGEIGFKQLAVASFEGCA